MRSLKSIPCPGLLNDDWHGWAVAVGLERVNGPRMGWKGEKGNSTSLRRANSPERSIVTSVHVQTDGQTLWAPT